MPITFGIVLLASLSMAGIFPLNGFLSKEMFFAETLSIESHRAFEWIVPIVATVAASASVAYSLRFFWGAFSTKADVGAMELHPTGFRILLGPLVLSLGTVGLGLAAFVVEALVAPYADTLAGPHDQHLALWHGFEPALAISAHLMALP